MKFKLTDKKAVEDLKRIEEPLLKSIVFHESKRSGKYFVIEIIDIGWGNIFPASIL